MFGNYEYHTSYCHMFDCVHCRHLWVNPNIFRFLTKFLFDGLTFKIPTASTLVQRQFIQCMLLNWWGLLWSRSHRITSISGCRFSCLSTCKDTHNCTHVWKCLLLNFIFHFWDNNEYFRLIRNIWRANGINDCGRYTNISMKFTVFIRLKCHYNL